MLLLLTAVVVSLVFFGLSIGVSVASTMTTVQSMSSSTLLGSFLGSSNLPESISTSSNLHEYTFTPFKKPRGGQLLELCKQANQYLAKFRIVVEHKIGLIKLFKMVANRYRNRRLRYDLRMRLFAGIVNFENDL